MTPAQKELARVNRIIETPSLLKALTANIEDGSHTLEDVLSEIADETLRERLRVALTA